MNLPKYHNDKSLQSLYITHDFAPDGDVHTALKSWNRCTWQNIQYDAKQYISISEPATRIASLWSSTHVYFAFACQYTQLNIYENEDSTHQRWELWNKDVVEIFINPHPENINHYYEFEVAPNNQWIDLEIDLTKQPFNNAEWFSGFEHATSIDESKKIWYCEMKIPVAAFGIDHITSIDEWRINCYRADGQGDDAQRTFLSWNVLPKKELNFHQPESFGILKFV